MDNLQPRFEHPTAPRGYQHVYNALFDRPWLLMPTRLAALGEVVRGRIEGFRLNPEAVAEIAAATRRPAPPASNGYVAVLPLYGTILWRAGGMEAASGASSLQDFSRSFDALMADASVNAIILDIDSPGGETAGVQETAAKVFAARGVKPVTAVVNALCASAAYWIAAAAEELVVTPSGMVGSVGVYMLHEDVSAAAEMDGVKFTFIEAPQGGYKTEGNPYTPLADDAASNFQVIVDDIYHAFVGALASYRGLPAATVQEQFGQGRVFLAAEAVKRGMADRVASLDDILTQRATAASKGARADAPAPLPLTVGQAWTAHEIAACVPDFTRQLQEVS